MRVEEFCTLLSLKMTLLRRRGKIVLYFPLFKNGRLLKSLSPVFSKLHYNLQ